MKPMTAAEFLRLRGWLVASDGECADGVSGTGTCNTKGALIIQQARDAEKRTDGMIAAWTARYVAPGDREVAAAVAEAFAEWFDATIAVEIVPDAEASK